MPEPPSSCSSRTSMFASSTPPPARSSEPSPSTSPVLTSPPACGPVPTGANLTPSVGSAWFLCLERGQCALERDSNPRWLSHHGCFQDSCIVNGAGGASILNWLV